MATVNYRIRSNQKKHVSIYVYLSLGRGNMFQSKTGFSILSSNWSSTTSRPKQNSARNKKLISDLNKLQVFILDEVNVAQSKGHIINKDWLDNKIQDCFSRVERNDENLIVTHIQYIIDNAETRKIRRSSKIGLSKRRIAGYKTFKGIFERYQIYRKSLVYFSDVNRQLVQHFTDWLIVEQNYSINHAGKQIDNLKTVCRDAESLDIKVHPYVYKIESFREQDEDRHIVTLSLNEIANIKSSNITSQALINARKWLIIGCAIGQRSSDLLKLTSQNIRYDGAYYYIDIIQQKTKKNVTIGLGDLDVIRMIENDEFPTRISQQKLNKHLKKLCAEAKINKITKGKKFDPKTKRKKLDFYPKYELITSHTFRRSFATNYYGKIDLPILMNITGHSKESLFLDYINKKRNKDENAKIFINRVKELRSDILKNNSF